MSEQADEVAPLPADTRADDPYPEDPIESQPGRAQDTAVLRSSAVMAAGTVVSRITGVLRDISIAAALGSFILADTYALGNSLPNIVYILVAGGALNAVFIPQLVRRMKTDSDGGDGYADRLITLVATVLLVTTVITVIAAPLIIRLYASAEILRPENSAAFNLAVAFARFCLPQIIFYGLYTMFAQVLNSRMHFAAPMFAPIVNNVVMIGTAAIFMWLVHGQQVNTETITPGQVTLLGIGSTLGVLAQALVLIPVLRRVNYRWRLRFDFRGHGLGKAGGLAGWTIGLVLVNQIGFFVITRLTTTANFLIAAAGGVPEGLASYQRAFLVFMLPHSVITISIVTALVPRMAQAAADGDPQRVGADVASGARLISALIVPCAFLLGLFGPFIGMLIFSFGQNAGAPAIHTGKVVACFAVGLLPFCLFYVLLRGWYAVEDTRTPFFITVGYNVIAIPLTLAMFAAAPVQNKVSAMALAYSFAYWLILLVAWFLLRRRLGNLQTRQTAGTIVRIFLAGLVATAAAFGSLLLLVHALGTSDQGVYPALTTSRLTSLLALVVGCAVLAVVYLVVASLLRVTEVGEVLGTIRSRIGR